MPKSGPIILIDDDADDQEIMEEVIRDLGSGHQLIHFKSAEEAFTYLVMTQEQPFLIFCDINLPMQNGIEFKKQIDEHEELRRKSIPFIFYSTSIHRKDVNEAYVRMTVQGFFQKGQGYHDIKRRIAIIIDYWKECAHPNSITT